MKHWKEEYRRKYEGANKDNHSAWSSMAIDSQIKDISTLLEDQLKEVEKRVSRLDSRDDDTLQSENEGHFYSHERGYCGCIEDIKSLLEDMRKEI